MRRRPALLSAVLAVLLAAALALLPGAAAADPSPMPHPSAGPISPGGSPAPGTSTPPAASPTPDPSAGGCGICGQSSSADQNSSLLDSLHVTDSHGVPVSHYDCIATSDADPGIGDAVHGNTGAFEAALFHLTCQLLFTADTYVVGVTAWFTGWLLDFPLANTLVQPVTNLAAAYQHNIIDRIGLTTVALTLGAVYGAVLILAGRTSRGVREIALTLLLFVIGVGVFTQPASVLLGDHGALGRTRDASIEIATMAADANNPHPGAEVADAGHLRAQLSATLVDTFVRKPHELINFGVVLDNSATHHDKCLSTYNSIVKNGPYGTGGDKAVAAMRRCNAGYADHAAHQSLDKVFAALLTLLAALIVTVILVLAVDLSFAGAQIGCAVLWPLGWPAAVLGLVGGGARIPLMRWGTAVFTTLLTVVATSFGLGFFLLTAGALQDATQNTPLVARFALIDLVALFSIAFFRRIKITARRAGMAAGRSVERLIGGRRRFIAGQPWTPAALYSESRRQVRSWQAPARWGMGRPKRPLVREGDTRRARLLNRLNRTRVGRISYHAVDKTVGLPFKVAHGANWVRSRSAAFRRRLNPAASNAAASNAAASNAAGTGTGTAPRTSTSTRPSAGRPRPGHGTSATTEPASGRPAAAARTGGRPVTRRPGTTGRRPARGSGSSTLSQRAHRVDQQLAARRRATGHGSSSTDRAQRMRDRLGNHQPPPDPDQEGQ